MSTAPAVQQQLDAKKNQINTLKYQKITQAPGDIDTLIRELQKVQETFRVASKMSNIGTQQFNTELEEIISKLQKVSRLVGDIKL